MGDEKKSKSIGVWPTVKPFVNGGASGMLATCVIQPIDMIKVKIQLGQGSAGQVTRNMLKEEGFGVFYKTVWNLRNSWVHGGDQVLLGSKLEGAVHFLEEFRRCRRQSFSSLHPITGDDNKWHAPAHGSLWLDKNASSSVTGFGATSALRDCKGFLVSADCWPRVKVVSVA